MSRFPASFFTASSPARGLCLSAYFRRILGQFRAIAGHSARLAVVLSPEMYIDLGGKDRNKKLFDRLLADKTTIEKECGASLTWERIDSKRASRVAIYREGGIGDSAEKRAEIQQWSVDNLLKLRKVLLPRAKAVLEDQE